MTEENVLNYVQIYTVGIISRFIAFGLPNKTICLDINLSLEDF